MGRPANVLRISPPLTVGKTDVNQAFQTLDRAFAEIG
jgi:4-aminobutyrate aminotransferase-like enzyme